MVLPPDSNPVLPHGGRLIDCQLGGEASEAALRRVGGLLRIPLSPVTAADLEMIAIGAYSPLTGFMNQADYKRVVAEMRLANGLIWPIPITLPVDNTLADKIKPGQEVALTRHDRILAIMEISEKFLYDKEQEARHIYQTTEAKHPGVARLYQQGNTLLAGDIWLLDSPEPGEFHRLPRTPAQTRKIFAAKKWQRIVGFQTRNPLHRVHEQILQHALEIVEGLFLHPIIGETKGDDVPAAVRFEGYRKLLRYHFRSVRQRILLGVFPAPMRYAGPREAIFHASCRKNYGCTHFIVGRDHAGVGHYYDPGAACEIFQEFGSGDEIGIELLFTPETKHYCRQCQGVVALDGCKHHSRIRLSGTLIREMLQHGEMPPAEIMHPEVSKTLLEAIPAQK